jgi:hypothetical protein
MLNFINSAAAFLATILGIGTGLEWFWNFCFGDSTPPPVLWASTITVSIGLIWLVIMYCTYHQGILRDEITRCAAAKENLEKTLLRNRNSSKKGKK